MAVHQEVGRKPGVVALGLRTKSWRRVRIALAERKYPKPQSTELFPTHALFCHGNSPHLFNERLNCGLDAVFSLMYLQGYLLLDSVIPPLSLTLSIFFHPPLLSLPLSFPLPSPPFLFETSSHYIAHAHLELKYPSASTYSVHAPFCLF